jgi:hypothetical protein
MSTTTPIKASQIRLSPDHLGITRGVNVSSAESLEITNQLLQRNHDELHIFFRDMNGHNHLVHNLLSRLALGANPEQLQIAFDDDLPTQRPMPPRDDEVILNLSNEDYFYAQIGKINNYTNFLIFFEQQIEQKGWRDVVNEYTFSHTRIAEAILPLMYDGAYHSIIHLGLGVEFEQPSIIAEALAQAAAHDSFNTDMFFLGTEQRARESALMATPGGKSLVELLSEAATNERIRSSCLTDGFIGTMKMKKCLFAKAREDIISLASQFRVTPETLERRTAEMISVCAYLSGATQRPGKPRKIDFFFMHCVTSSIFFTVLARQSWISIENRVRLVEWKGRLDLAWYAVCGVPELNINDVISYHGGCSDMDWNQLFTVVNNQHDDGHVAKFVRALKNGEEASKLFEQLKGSDAFPIKGDLWLKVARMAYDTTLDLSGPAKWVVMTGMDKAWEQVSSE